MDTPTTVAPAPQTVAASSPVAAQPPSLLPNLNGALAALPVSNMLVAFSAPAPEPVVVVRYVQPTVKLRSTSAKRGHEFPMEDIVAMVPDEARAKVEASLEVARKQLRELKASAPADFDGFED